MAVTKLEQWKNERNAKTMPCAVGEKTHVIKVECKHCNRQFLRWTSMAAAYRRCDDCTAGI